MKDSLLKILKLGSERAVADLAVLAINNEPAMFRVAVDISLEEKYPMSMRAARVVQLCCSQNPGLLRCHIEEIIQKALVSKIDGVKRNYLKILDDFVDLAWIAEAGSLVDRCFDILSDPAEKPATRIHAAGILLRYARLEPDLGLEIRQILVFQPDAGCVSFNKCTALALKELDRLGL